MDIAVHNETDWYKTVQKTEKVAMAESKFESHQHVDKENPETVLLHELPIHLNNARKIQKYLQEFSLFYFVYCFM